MKKVKKQKKINYIILFITIIFITAIIGYFLYEYNLKIDNDNLKKQMEDEESFQNKVNITIEKEEKQEIENEQENKNENVIYSSKRIDKLKELKLKNSDIVGWLEIPNTNISYPVVQGIDNDYYMRRNYQKKYTIEGSLFLDKNYNWNEPSSNLLIYGHNNRGSSGMFVGLMDYKDESFYKEHNTMRFTTDKDDAIYDIISVFFSRVYYKREEDVFRYYYFINAENKEEFEEYISECKKASIYPIKETAEYGDQLITLSTCEYSQEDGRFVVVARKRKD